MILKYTYSELLPRKLKYILKDRLYISTNLLKKLKLNNAIYLNGNLSKVDEVVYKDDIVEVKFDYILGKQGSVVPTFHPIDILYEDEYLIVVNKPAFMDSHPSMGNFDSTLANFVMYYFNEKKYNIGKIHIVTRLDKNTSGCILIAKNEYVQELFTRRHEYINLKKEYIALCSGLLKDDHFFINKNIKRKENSIILRETTEEGGDSAITEVNVLKRDIACDYTVCRVTLHTGRTHQIRVHFSSIMHPLLGDDLYNRETTPEYNITKYILRQALHSYKISFIHPITNQTKTIYAPIPEDIKKLIKEVQIYKN